MINYGKKLKEIRNYKGMTLDCASKGILTKSGLSKFERGEISITFDKLLKILNNLSISLEEFEFYCRGADLSDFDLLVRKVQSAYVSNNSLLLKHLSKTETTKFTVTKINKFRLNGIMIAILYEDLTQKTILFPDDLQVLIDYLFGLEHWFYYDVVLFGNSITKLPHNLIQSIYREMILKTDIFGRIPKNRKLIGQTLLNISVFYLKDKKIEHSRHSLASSINFLEQTDFYEKFLYSFLEASLTFLDSSQNKNNVLKILTALKELVDDEIYVNYYDFFKTYVEPQNFKL